MRFQILNKKRFPLKVQNINDNVDLLPYYRWEHRATIGWNTREFMVFIDNGNPYTKQPHKAYIEEIVGGHLESIVDDSLFAALEKFAQEYNLMDILVPITKNFQERFI